MRRMFSSGFLFFLIVAGGAVAFIGNFFYPSGRERETKEQLAENAKAILLPEIQHNENVVANCLKLIKEKNIPTVMLDVTAWQTVSSGGLLSGLKPAETTKFLRIYNLVFQANDVSRQLTEVTIGTSSTLTTAPQVREFLGRELETRLTWLQEAFSEIK
jgi:hypothetical protein